LMQVLARQQLVVALDNCEHVIGAVAELCAGLLQACDDVRILATSREPLRIAGEAAYRLARCRHTEPDGFTLLRNWRCGQRAVGGSATHADAYHQLPRLYSWTAHMFPSGSWKKQ
jgi:predicted ATPase